MVKTDKTLDIQGLAGPRPKIITEETLEKMNPGQVLMVITNDRNAKQSIPSLCETRGYALLGFREDSGTLYFIIQK